MTKPTYIIEFNSRGSNALTENEIIVAAVPPGDAVAINLAAVQSANQTSALLCKMTYNVNWNSFIPLEYKKFRCSFIFRSDIMALTTATYLNENGLISMNILKTNIFNGSELSNNIGMIYPVVASANTRTYYNSSAGDNPTFEMLYPTNQQITISIKHFNDNVPLIYLPQYILYLTMEVIE